MDIAFEWDDAKAQSNLAKHGVPFAYATRVFSMPGSLISIRPAPEMASLAARRWEASKVACSRSSTHRATGVFG
jgi:uncharacterized DUF497 family protein